MPAPWYAPNVAKDDTGTRIASSGGAHGTWKSRWGPIPAPHRRALRVLAGLDLLVDLLFVAMLFANLEHLAFLLLPLGTVAFGWAALDLACMRGQPEAVSIRRGVSVVATLILALFSVRRDEGGGDFDISVSPAITVAAAVVSAALGIASHLALRASLRSRVDPLLAQVFGGPRERHDGEPSISARRSRTARLYAALVGPVYVVCGAVESLRGTWWFGLLYASAGVCVMLTADTLLPRPEAGFSSRRRRRPLGRATGAPAVLFLLGAVAVAVRAVWLLGNHVPMRFRL